MHEFSNICIAVNNIFKAALYQCSTIIANILLAQSNLYRLSVLPVGRSTDTYQNRDISDLRVQSSQTQMRRTNQAAI